MKSFENMLEKYAEPSVKVGVNIQNGQTLVINAPIVAADFIRKVTKKAYEAGANTSLTHVDFMVGSPKMNIDGETVEGKIEAIFRDGNWAF